MKRAKGVTFSFIKLVTVFLNEDANKPTLA